jgi:hypothetical protein
MPKGWEWNETLYLGSAPYDVHGRPPYAPGLAAALAQLLALDGQGRLRDVGCGPGVVTIPLAPMFAEAVAVAPDAGLLADGEHRANAAGIASIRWVRALSGSAPHLLGAHLPRFESELRRLLGEATSTGVFAEQPADTELFLWRTLAPIMNPPRVRRRR